MAQHTNIINRVRVQDEACPDDGKMMMIMKCFDNSRVSEHRHIECCPAGWNLQEHLSHMLPVCQHLFN